MTRRSYTTLDRLWSWTRPEIYRMAPIQLGLLIPLVLFIASLARMVDGFLGLPRPLHQPVAWVLGLLLLGVSAGTVYWAYSHLALEGQGSPNPHFRQTTRVVDNGPYAVVRHPTVLGKLLGVIGVGLAFRSPTFLCFVVPFFVLGATISNRFTQEVPLERGTGDVYRTYRQKVPMFLPRPRDALTVLGRAWPVAVSGALVVIAAAVAGPGAFDWAGLWPPPAALAAAAGLFALPVAVRAVALRGPSGLSGSTLLVHAAGLNAARHLMHLRARRMGEVTGGLFRERAEAVEIAVAASRRARTWALLAVFVPAGLVWTLASPSVAGGVAVGGLVVSSWRSGGPGAMVGGLVEAGAGIGALTVLCGVAGVPVQAALGVLPVVVLLSGLRLSWDGVGVQDLALVLLLGLVGVDAAPALSLSLLAHLVRVAVRMAGGFAFLLTLARSGYAPSVSGATPVTRSLP